MNFPNCDLCASLNMANLLLRMEDVAHYIDRYWEPRYDDLTKAARAGGRYQSYTPDKLSMHDLAASALTQ